MMFLARLIQFMIIAIPIALMGWLVNQWVIPSGVFSVSHTVGDASPFIDELKPETRVSEVKEGDDGAFQAIQGDPVSFFIHPHRDFFEEVELEVWFKNNALPIVELGALADVDPESYTLYPLHNRLIDESVWTRLDQEGLVLLQKEARYDSIGAFFVDPPSREEVAVYRTDFSVPYRIDGYQPLSSAQTIDVSLRGYHEFKTYIKDETLSFSFYYMDMNRDEGEDVVRVTVFDEEGRPVAESRAPDDGNVSDNAIVDHGLKELKLAVSGLSEGVYKVVMDAPNDIFFRKIQTPQQKIVFLNSLFIGDEFGYREPPHPVTVYTQSKYLRLQTRHADGVQTLTTRDQTLEIDEPYAWYALRFEGTGLEGVTLPKGDIELITEGTFAFSPSHYFQPDPVSLNAYTTLEQLGVNYVLAQYQSPRREGDWLVARVTFPTAELYEEDATWKFTFSAPFIAELATKLLVHRIDAWLYRFEYDVETQKPTQTP